MRYLRSLAFTALMALGLCVALPASAAVPANPGPPSASYNVGSIHVDEYGTVGKPALIFIPGLTCGPWEWYGEIGTFAPDYHIYALTLPGFDGQPAVKSDDLFGLVSSDFWKFLSERNVQKPWLVGHSLGGTLAIDLAEQHPELLRGIIAVDGMPILPGFDRMTADQRKAVASKIAGSMATATPAQFAATLPRFTASLVTSETDLAAIDALAAKSDPAATAAWYAQDIENDLRPGLSKITVPFLEVAPFDKTIDGRFGANSAADVATYYESLLKGAPTVKVVTIEPSRHFIMYDQPAQLHAMLASFLQKHA